MITSRQTSSFVAKRSCVLGSGVAQLAGGKADRHVAALSLLQLYWPRSAFDLTKQLLHTGTAYFGSMRYTAG
jgi:hypothetical protein